MHLFKGQGPCPNYNFKATLVSCIGTGIVFLFGGFDDSDTLDSNVYLLDTHTMTWLVDDKHKGLYREGHLAVYIGNGNVLVFGGIPTDEEFSSYYNTRSHRNNHNNYGEDPKFKKNSIMLIYNIFDKSWTSPPDFALSNAPSSRSRHACCLSPDKTKVYISGGVMDSNTLNGLYSYDFTSGAWDGPYDFVHRFDHFITIYDDKLFSFGGLNKNMNHVKDRISYFDLKDQTIGEITLLLSSIHDNIDNFITAYNSCQRIHLDNNLAQSIKLDVTLPLNNFGNNKDSGFFIAYYNLKQLKHVSLIELNDVKNIILKKYHQNISEYVWKDCVISDHGSILLFGSPMKVDDDEYENENEVDNGEDFDNTEENGDEDNMYMGGVEELLTETWPVLTQSLEFNRTQAFTGFGDSHEEPKLSVVLEMSLRDIGIEFVTDPLDNDKALSKDLSQDFKRLLEQQEFTDFEIVCLKSFESRDQFTEFPEVFSDLMDDVSKGATITDQRVDTIKVHRTILLARWPHFRRLIESGMTESKCGRMFIPEPSNWVKGLIYYLYTGTINFDSLMIPHFTLVDYSGLLILSNFYELVELRSKVLSKIYESIDIFIRDKLILLDSEFQIGAILKIWINVIISNEDLLVGKLTQLIKLNWQGIVKSQAFSKLPKPAIIKLIQSCTAMEDLEDQNSKHNTPKRVSSRLDLVIGSTDLSSSPLGSSPDRDCNSPFLQSSAKNDRSREYVDLSYKLPVLQHLSDSLSESVDK